MTSHDEAASMKAYVERLLGGEFTVDGIQFGHDMTTGETTGTFILHVAVKDPNVETRDPDLDLEFKELIAGAEEAELAQQKDEKLAQARAEAMELMKEFDIGEGG